MQNAITAEHASHLIGLIYDCVIEPARWPSTVQALHQELGFANCSLSLLALPSAKPLLNVQSGMAPEWVAKIPQFSHAIPDIWGGIARMGEFPLDEPIVNSEAVDRSIWVGNPWYEEWSKPQGLVDVVAVSFARDPSAIGAVAWGIHESQGSITDAQRTMLRLLAPHFRRAVSIAKLLDMQALAADTFESALDRFSTAILLVDEELNIVHSNAAASTILRDQDPVRAQNGRLALPHPQSTSALAEAVRRAALGGLELGQRGIGIPARRRDGSPAVVHVMPLRTTGRASAMPQRAVAAVFVATATSPPQMPAAALALLHDLTPAETRVLELIAQGKTPAEIASQLGISLSTTRTHLQRVFDKTGTSRQVELVRLVGSLSLPV